jgi:hypothetical protein
VIAGLLIVNVIVAIATYPRIMRVAREVYPGLANGQDLITALRVVLIVVIIVDILIAGLFVLLGAFDRRGVNGMRITTWVIGGLGVLCLGAGLGTSGASTTFNSGGDPQQREAARRITDATAGAPHAITVVVDIIGLLALIAVIILLAMPASNEFFKSRKQAMVAPGYPAEPGYPAYPTYPSYPTYPQAGPQPGAPPPPPPGGPQTGPYAAPPYAGSPQAGPPQAGPPYAGQPSTPPPATPPAGAQPSGNEPPTAPPSRDEPPTDEPPAGSDRPDGPR